MILRFVQESIRRAPRRKALIIAAIAMGSAVATAMLGVMLDIGDKINRELRQVGANIVVTSQAAALTGGVGSFSGRATGTASYIPEAEVPNVKKIFWGLNILGFSPSLSAQDGGLPVEGVWFSHTYTAPDGSSQATGITKVNPAWRLRAGHWPVGARNDCAVGLAAAHRHGWKAGSEITVLGAPFTVAGIFETGDEAEDRVLLPLERVQELTQRPGLVDRIDVAALTKPEDDFARKDPKTMTTKERERWSCSNYAISLADEIQQALPGTIARPVRRVADSEGQDSWQRRRPDGAYHFCGVAFGRFDGLEPDGRNHDGTARRGGDYAGDRRGPWGDCDSVWAGNCLGRPGGRRDRRGCGDVAGALCGPVRFSRFRADFVGFAVHDCSGRDGDCACGRGSAVTADTAA